MLHFDIEPRRGYLYVTRYRWAQHRGRRESAARAAAGAVVMARRL